MKKILIDELKYFQKKYSFKVEVLSEKKLIIPEYKIELLNKSKKVIKLIENISNIIQLNINSLDNRKIKKDEKKNQKKFKKN